MKPVVHWNTPTVKEFTIQLAILDYLRLRGVTAWRTHSPRNHPETAGTPDILGILRGHFLAIEVKKPGGRITREQAAMLAEIRAAGGLAVVATSVVDVDKAIREALKTRRPA